MSRNTNYLDRMAFKWHVKTEKRPYKQFPKMLYKIFVQVEFLNSVIVDMQRKNDDLKTKLELYESAGILDESVDFIFNGVSSRLKTNFFRTGF